MYVSNDNDRVNVESYRGEVLSSSLSLSLSLSWSSRICRGASVRYKIQDTR